ncbi:MAG TPA: pitrilysin family protein [Pyrinomonadaceae bacterium]|nr:pitrilysin family protein [Pyrinomonadaceae bacterium]
MSFRHCAKLCLFTFLAFSLFISNIQAQTLPKGITKVTSVEGLTEYRLENGLRVVLFPDATKTNITVNIVYLVGSRHENYGETGMAHLLEHLVFKGTPKHPNIPAELTARGTQPNGTTWYDRTNYYETFAATDENLDWALDLESDRMVNSYIAKKDLDSEFSVVRNELESGENNAFGILLEKIMATAYQWHNYGKTTIGARSDLENVPIDRLQAFYKRYYQPDNAVLVVAGKIDEAKTLNLIQQKFGSIPKPTRELPKIYTTEPTQDGERSVTLRRVGDAQYAMAGYHIPSAAHSDFQAVQILGRILADVPSGRLHKNLVETKKASGVFNINMQNRDSSYMLFGAELDKTTSLDAARDTLIETVESFTKTPPTKDEVERHKATILKNIELSLNDPNGVALQLTDWIARGDWRLFFLNRDRMKKVTADDVQRVAKTYLKQSNRTSGVFIPTEKPDRAEIPKLSDNDITAMVTDYKGETLVSMGEVFEPSPTNIEGRVQRWNIGGLKVAFMPKENRGDAVFMRVNLRFGDAKSLMNRSTAGNFAGQMLMRGTAKKSRQQIKDELDRLKARGFVGGSATSAFASMETTRDNLPEVIKLVGELLRESNFPQAEFDQLKAETLTALENERSDPQSVAIRAMSADFNRYPKGDIRYSMTLDEEIAAVKALTLDDVKKFYKDFYGASSGEFAVVGDTDKAAVSSAEQVFGSWKSPAKYERVPSEYFDVPAINKSFETPDKANAFFLARLNVKMRDDNPDYAAFTLGNFMLGGGFLNSRLAVRIRQKEGISYGVGSNFGASSLDENGTFNAFAIYAPQNVAKLEMAFKEEIQKVISDGFTAEEFEQAKAGWLLSRQRNRGNDGGLVQTLSNYLFLNRTFAWDADIEKKVQSMTVADVNAAMKKHLTFDKISIFKAGDFANAKK